LISLVFLLIPFSGGASATDASETLCRGKDKVAIPTSDQPKKEHLPSLKNCDAEALYYGMGTPIDYQKARLCAYLERDQGRKDYPIPFVGSSILMMLYANGLGVPKNIPLAERFACEEGGAPAEIEGRIQHLEKMKTALNTADPFDLCDDITSGFMAGHCSAHGERISTFRRAATLKAITTPFTAPQKEAFLKLQAASEKFAEERANNEINSGGTLSAMFIVNERSIQKQDFLESLQKLEANKAPKYTLREHQEVDKKLNVLYQKLQKGKLDPDLSEMITPEGIRKTQRAWLNYRDAWIAFARTKYPTYPPLSVSTWFTKKRNHMLENLQRHLLQK